MSKLDLSQEELEEVLSILKQHVPECVVWAYGSRVKGINHAASDLDLVVIDVSDKHQLVGLKQAFQESNLAILVDVMDWERLPEAYREEIQSCHIKLYPTF